jgi:hypothetical protein
MKDRSGRIPAGVIAPRGARGGSIRIWLPWFVAPLFALAPVAGCALAGRVKQLTVGGVAADPAATLTAPEVTFGPGAPEQPQGGPAAAVVPVEPAAPPPAR